MATPRHPYSFLNELKLQTVDIKSKYIVFGYIRKQQNNNLFKILPKLITVIILAFYDNNTDRFNSKLCSKHIKITKNNTIIDTKKKHWGIVFGKKIIPSTKNEKYIWKFKSIGKTVKYITIGIENVKRKSTRNCFNNQEKAWYAFVAYHGTIRDWKKNTKDNHPTWKPGDTLAMILQSPAPCKL